MDLLNGDSTQSSTHQGIVSLLESASVQAIHVANFLPKEERDALFEAVCKGQEAFQTAGLPGTPSGPTKHFSLGAGGSEGKDNGAIKGAHEPFARRLIEQLPNFCEALGIEPLNTSNIPINLMSGLHGHVGQPHADSTNGQYQISILYYFHRTPKVFRGGDLEFYATDEMRPQGHSEKPLFSIDLKDNLLVVFRSETFHGVTEVECDSTDFADGRFVAVGFIGA